jgi:hypothetical protein
MRAAWRGRTRGPLLVLLAVTSARCNGKPQECVPCVEPDGTYGVELKAVEAVVDEVQAGQPPGSTPGTPGAEHSFQLAAWYLDVNDSIVSGRFDTLVWTANPPNGITPGEFGRITVSDYASTPVILRVASPNGGFQDQVALRRWDHEGTAAAAEDVVVAPRSPGRVPEAVLVEERKGGVCDWGRAWAFVGFAAVGQQSEQPCSLAVLSADHEMVFQDPVLDDWVPPPALQNAPGAPAGSVITTAPGQPREVPVTIFIAVTSRTVSLLSQLDLSDNAQLAQDVAAAAEAQARTDVLRTNMIFQASRVGIRIKVNDEDYVRLPLTPTLPTDVGAMDPFSCGAPRTKLARPDPVDPTVPFGYNPAAISVYYVDWIDYPAEPPTHPGASGMHCPYRTSLQEGPVIYISYTRQSTLTLAHEIGHALKLDHPPIGTLDALNLMQGWLDDGPLGADARSRLTVGQAMRMNIENESWISKLPIAGPTRKCWVSDPCPPDELDAR